jgi:hypothetical protein
MEFKSVQLSGGYPHLKQPLAGAGLCACPRKLDSLGICDECDTQQAVIDIFLDAGNHVNVLF